MVWWCAWIWNWITEGNLATDIDDRITHIACQPSEEGAVQKLENRFYLLKDKTNRRTAEIGENYCKDVLEKVRDFQKDSNTDEETEEEEFDTIDQSEFNKCEMESCGDLCGDCKVRFYHNYIDKDSHFETNKNGNQVRYINVLIVTLLHHIAYLALFKNIDWYTSS